MLRLPAKKVSLIILVGVAVITVAGFLYWLNEVNFEQHRISRGDLKIFIASSGKIEAEEKANLDYNYAGWITDLPVKENDSVSKGEVVARIDPTEAEKNLSAAEASYRSAKSALEKIIDDIHLFQYGNGGFGNVGTANETQTQKTARQQAEEAVNIANDNLLKARNILSKSVLKSPFDGTVTRVSAQLNESTSAFSQQPIIQIVDFSTLYFDAEIDQENSGLVETGQKATVTLDAKKDKPLDGIITEIANSTRTTPENDQVLPVKIRLNSTEGLKLGWVGDVTIDLKTVQNVLLVPKRAIEYVNGKSSVRVNSGFFTKLKPVSLGEFDGVNWQVKEGVEENEVILIKQ